MTQLNLFANDQAANGQAANSQTGAAERETVTEETEGPFSLSAYKIRESKRAKHVSIKISVEGEVEVVVPTRFERSRLPDILEKRQEWIEKTRAKLLRDRANTPEDWQVEQPDMVVFRWRSRDMDDASMQGQATASKAKAQKTANAKGKSKGFGKASAQQKVGELETWSINYDAKPGNITRCIPDEPYQITVSGNTDHLPACQEVLRKWLAYRAKKDLGPWLRQISFDIDLPFRKLSVRGQKTCWASCSTRKDISLNFKLLFLPRPLVHYVLVHELCHTIHMNHSQDFWALVGQKQPDYEWRKKAIKDAWRYVPRWVEAK
ncbi:MAG: M48 family metallopeptidase [Cyanobacteria bacterium P01_F01_bin.3]